MDFKNKKQNGLIYNSMYDKRKRTKGHTREPPDSNSYK